MSIASFFFAASREQAQLNNGFEGAPPGHRAEFFRVTDISLKPLFTAIAGEACPRFEPVATSEDFTQITFRFPDGFVEGLAALDESAMPRLIAEWRESGDAPYNRDEDLQNLLCSLLQLARLARRSGHGLYLWNCS